MNPFFWLIIAIIIYVIIVSPLHELGHYIMLKLIGINSKITFALSKFKVSYDNDVFKTKKKYQKILVESAGILLSLICVIILYLLAGGIIINEAWFRTFILILFMCEILIQTFNPQGDLRKALNEA
ncbi:hypothetical protein COY95_02935 [Candidatus Woesearchaeota archaeon CG_4_10_14_0_8_um_filter_47_5]|nr:MAG: hypothetical protein COY95_02935 [Candidatus Woesearchaeota archaeon CG_4_10_14_0_8_um_filter_47_5]